MVVEDDDTNTCSHGCIHICSVDTHRHTHTYTNTRIFYIYWLREQSDSKFGLSSINHSSVLVLLLFFSFLYFTFFFTSLLFFQVRMCLLPFAFINISLTFSHTHVHSLTCIFSYGNCDFARERKKNCTHTHGRFFFCWSSLLFYFIENNKRHEKKLSALLFVWQTEHQHIHNIIFELNALKLHHKCIFCSPFIFFFHHQ